MERVKGQNDGVLLPDGAESVKSGREIGEGEVRERVLLSIYTELKYTVSFRVETFKSGCFRFFAYLYVYLF